MCHSQLALTSNSAGTCPPVSERSPKLPCSPAGKRAWWQLRTLQWHSPDSTKLSCACFADLQEGADKLQRNFDQAANQAASRAESLVDKVSQGAQSAADSVADVIESFKSEKIDVAGVPPVLSVQDCWLAACFALGWLCCIVLCQLCCICGMSTSVQCSECGRHHILHSAPVNNRPPAASRLLWLQQCFAKARLHATTASQEGRNLLEHSIVSVRCG